MSMKHFDDATQHDALARLAAAKPHIATDRPDDFIAAAIANSGVLAASAKSPKRRVRSLTFAAVAAVCIVSASVAGPGMLTASNQPDQKNRGAAIATGELQAGFDQTPDSGYAASVAMVFAPKPAYFDYSISPSVPYDSSPKHIYREVPLKNHYKIAQQLINFLGLSGQKPMLKRPNLTNQSLQYVFGNQKVFTTIFVGRYFSTTKISSWHFPPTFGGTSTHSVMPPSVAEAKKTAERFLKALGLTVTYSGPGHDGAYLIRVTDTTKHTNAIERGTMGGKEIPPTIAPVSDSSLDFSVTANLVANGQPSPVGLKFSWSRRNGKLSIDGTLATLKDLGLKQTIAPVNAVKRIGQFPPYWWTALDFDRITWSNKTYQAMGQPLWNQLVACKKHRGPKCPYAFAKLRGQDYPVLPVPATRVESATLETIFMKGAQLLIPGYYFYDKTGFIGSAESLSIKDFNAPPLTHYVFRTDPN